MIITPKKKQKPKNLPPFEKKFKRKPLTLEAFKELYGPNEKRGEYHLAGLERGGAITKHMDKKGTVFYLKFGRHFKHGHISNYLRSPNVSQIF